MGDTLEALAGRMPDGKVAERLGMDVKAVKAWRRAHGVAPFLKPPPPSPRAAAVQPQDPPVEPASSRRVVRRRGTEQSVEVVAPRGARPSVAPAAASGGKTLNTTRTSTTARLDALREQMGSTPDGAIAQQAGVSRRVVGAYRRKHGIPSYEGYLFKPGHAPLTGQRVEADEPQDAPVATKAAVTPAAVTASRTSHRIPRAGARAKEAPVRRQPEPAPVPREGGAPATDSRLAAFADQMGTVSDREVAALAGATREAVGMYRRAHGIPAWQGFRSKPRRSAAAKLAAAAPPAPPVVRRLVAYSILASSNGVQREFIAVGENIAIACERAQEGFDARDDGPWHVDLIKLVGDAFA